MRCPNDLVSEWLCEGSPLESAAAVLMLRRERADAKDEEESGC
jgi:hypothetical protein